MLSCVQMRCKCSLHVEMVPLAQQEKGKSHSHMHILIAHKKTSSYKARQEQPLIQFSRDANYSISITVLSASVLLDAFWSWRNMLEANLSLYCFTSDLQEQQGAGWTLLLLFHTVPLQFLLQHFTAGGYFLHNRV